jgi:hypothetical protein
VCGAAHTSTREIPQGSLTERGQLRRAQLQARRHAWRCLRATGQKPDKCFALSLEVSGKPLIWWLPGLESNLSLGSPQRIDASENWRVLPVRASFVPAFVPA